MINALELYERYRGQDLDRDLRERQFSEQSQARGMQNQLMQFNMQKARADMERENQRRNYLAQAAGGNMNALMLADPKAAIQQQQMQSRERLGREGMVSRERMMRDRIRQQAEAARIKNDPALAGQIAQEKERAKFALQMPEALATSEQAVKQIDELIGDESGTIKPHPGLETAVGMTWLPGARFIPGSDTADFMRRLDQVKGGAFMQAFQTLKGGGQITEREGEKATAAITRMDTSQSEKEFRKAAREFQGIIRSAMERAKTRAAPQGRQTGAGEFKVLGVEKP
jgi:hypothetical protein